MQRRCWWWWGVVALLWGVVGQPAGAQVRGTIFGPGVRQYPVALSPLAGVSVLEQTDTLGAEFVGILQRDLELSGLFRVIPRSAYIEPPVPVTAQSINFDNWSVIGALALVKGSVRLRAGELIVEVHLFDVARRRSLTGRRYRGRLTDLRRAAHRFADEVLRVLTGKRGPFDSKITFLSTRGGRFKNVYVMSLDGGDMQRVTAEDTLNVSPGWGPDGQSLVLTSYRAGNPDLFSIGLSGSRWTRLSSLRGINVGGRWSPDGRELAVTVEYEGNSEIVILSPEGSVRRRLTDHWAIDVSPTWSPDGRRIAFCSSRAGSPQIYIVNAAGGPPRRVTRDGSYNTSPSWSPSGDRLAYTSRVAGRFQIFTVRPDGAGVHQVTRSDGDNEDPSWSPDGRYVVFSSTRAGSARLYMADRTGASQVELTGGKGSDTSPSWSGWLD